MLPVLLLRTFRLPFRSWIAANAVTMASRKPSGISWLSAGRRDKGFVRVEPSMQRSTAFVESRFEGPFHDAAPASIDPDLVGRVDGGHGVFKVLERRYRRFRDHV